MSPEPSTEELAGFLAAHAPLIESLYANAAASSRDVSRQTFATALYRSAMHRFAGAFPSDTTVTEYLGTLHSKDLALACALLAGSETAWEEFIARYRPLLYAAARAIVGAAGEARARELADSLYAELYGLDRSGNQRRRSLLDYFHGRSKLSTWLRTLLTQRHVDALRAGQRIDSLDAQQRDQPPGLAAVQARSAPPAIDGPDRNRLVPPLRDAVSAALAALPPADHLLLSLYYLQEMTLAQIARLRGVHEATVSRQLDRLRGDLRKGIETALATGRPAVDGRAAVRGLSPAEVKLCMAYALDDWPFDLSRALAVSKAPAPSGEMP